MPLQILGLNHNTAPVEIREQVVFSGDDVTRALGDLTGLDGVTEALLLSTCNRTEFYVISEAKGQQNLRNWLHNERSLDPGFGESLFTRQGDDAIRHIFRVACGLDSMVLGEPQILGQLKDAFRVAQSVSTVGPELDRLMQHTFAVAKKVRTDTEIGSSPVSVASAAVNLASQFFSGFDRHTALLIGAGTTIELVAKHLASRDIGRLFVANRSIERASEVAHRFGGYALPLSEIEGTLPEADILISSTSATSPIITAEQLREAIRLRKRRPIFAVDLAVPRDIEPEAADVEDAFLYTVDDLDRVIQEGQGSREAAAVEAEKILVDEIARYQNVERMKQAVPLIAALRDNSESVRNQIVEQATRRMRNGESADDAIRFATAALMKKMLHNPSIALRKAGEESDDDLLKAARTIFGIDEE